MLSLPISFIKDAARSVKRICKEEFKQVYDSALTELLGISALIVTMYMLRSEDDQEVLHLCCVHRNDVAICPKCGAICEDIHGEKKRCIRHLNIWGKRTFLHFMSRRFKCDECNKVFTEELSFIDSYRRQSHAFEQHVYESCLSSSRKKVAIREGLSQSCVRDILQRYSPKKNSFDRMTTRVLGIDEISLKKRYKQYVLVISDIERKCILAILPDREKKSLVKWIQDLNYRQKKAIKYVSIDMWKPYAQAIRAKLPRSILVVDRFHVMKQLNERMNQVRRRLQNKDAENKELLKGSRWILVKNRCDLSSKEEKRLSEILDNCRELRQLYLLKEEFRTIFEKINDREKAQRFLLVWKRKCLATGNRYLIKFAGTLKNWWKEILNYFIERVSNGYVEGQNNAIRNIIRRAFGYRNFNNFRFQVFAELGFHTNPR